MLTLAVTLLIALYLIAPELISRSIISSRRPVKTIPRTHTEELFHSILWVLLPLAITVFIGVPFQRSRWSVERPLIAKVFEDLYSDKLFAGDRNFYPALHSVVILNLEMLLPLYGMVIVLSLLLVAYETDRIPAALHFLHPMLSVLAWMLLPSIPELYLVLAVDQIPRRSDVEKHVDVLTKGGILYRGRVGSLALNNDGSLQLLQLENPRRFVPDAQKGEALPGPTLDHAWLDIPGHSFVIVGAEVANLNLRFVPRNPISELLTPEQRTLLDRLFKEVQQEIPAEPRSEPPMN